jgi:hypothetical protein
LLITLFQRPKPEEPGIEQTPKVSELQQKAAKLPVASSIQIFDALGLSSMRQQEGPTPIERLNKFLNATNDLLPNNNTSVTLWK